MSILHDPEAITTIWVWSWCSCTHLQTPLQTKVLSHRHKRPKQKEYLNLSISGIWVWKKPDDSIHSRAWWIQKKETQEVSSEIICVPKMIAIYLGHTVATSWKELTHWKRPCCWEGLGAGGEGDDRGWDGWMASPTRWAWVWVKSGSLWWTGRPGVLRFMGSQRVRHNWATELNSTD